MQMKKTSLQTLGLLVALGAIVAAAPFIWSLQSNDEQTTPDRAGLEVGASMPEIEGQGWLNGDGPHAAELKGKVVVVNAWRDFCPKCHQGMPKLVATHAKFKNRGVVFVGMTTFQDENELDRVKADIQKYGITWPNAYGADASMIKFKVEYIPGYWVIGRNGKVIWNKASDESMDDAIERALNDGGESV